MACRGAYHVEGCDNCETRFALIADAIRHGANSTLTKGQYTTQYTTH